MTEKSRKSIAKIIQHADRVMEYTKELNQEQFRQQSLVFEAVAFNVSQIGELARLVDQETVAANPHIDWTAMRGLRNRIVHDYDNVSPTIIWAVVTNDLPQLTEDLKRLL